MPLSYTLNSLQDTKNLAINSYSHVFQPIFYILGIIDKLNSNILKHFDINFDITPHEFESILNTYGFPLNNTIQFIDKMYKNACITHFINVKTCFYIRRIFNYLKNLKDVDTLYTNDFIYIINNLIQNVHYEILIRAPEWFSKHSKKKLEYWPSMFKVKSDTFTYLQNSQGRIVDGYFDPKFNSDETFTEFYVQPVNYQTDFIKFTRTMTSSNVNIWWAFADYHEWFTGKVCDNIFYEKGGMLCKLFYAKQNRVHTINGKDKVIADQSSKLTNTDDFIKILIDNSVELRKCERTIETPWGLVAFNINKIQISENSPPHFKGILI